MVAKEQSDGYKFNLSCNFYAIAPHRLPLVMSYQRFGAANRIAAPAAPSNAQPVQFPDAVVAGP
jgi:hypothetical protein